MSNSKFLLIYARVVAAVSLLLLAFLIVKDYSSLEMPTTLPFAVSLFVSLLSIILFASFCVKFSVDSNIRPAGFTLLLAFVLEFLTAALSCMPAAKSSYIIIALVEISPIVGFILLVLGLFGIASKGSESRRFQIASRCFAGAKLLYALVVVGGGIIVAMSAMNGTDVDNIKELLLKLGIVFGHIIPTVAACWFYWELGKWIAVRWEIHKIEYT